MNFAFDEEQKGLGDTVGRLLADHAALTGPDLSPEHNVAAWAALAELGLFAICLLYTSPSPRDRQKSRMPSSA